MERLTEKQHLKLNKQEAYRLYIDTLHELALVMNDLHNLPQAKKDNLYAF